MTYFSSSGCTVLRPYTGDLDNCPIRIECPIHPYGHLIYHVVLECQNKIQKN